jgi:hypothetical protein
MGSNPETVKKQIHELLSDINKKENSWKISAYNRVMIESDFTIHLMHESDKVIKTGSELGLYLSASLKEFGMVNHSIWIQEV